MTPDSWRIPLVLLVLLAMLGASSGAQPPAHAAEPPVTADRMAQWIQALDSERFVEREVATERLIAAGSQAVAPVAKAVAGSNLEVTSRGLYILQELALALDAETVDAAYAALERIAESRVTSAGRRASAILARLDAVRQQRALEELKRLGAVVADAATPFGTPAPGQYSIAFAESWRGEPRDLARLRWLRDVANVFFQGERITDACLQHVAAIRGLESLTIKRAKITDGGVAQLKGLRKLRALSLLYLPITDRSVDTLNRIEGMGTLRVYGTRITEAGAAALEQALAGTKVDYRPGGAFLGIGCEPGQQGCVVYLVRPNTAAQRGDLKPQDVVRQYDGKPVTSFEQLTALIAKNRPGDKVAVQIVRDGQTLTKQITLDEWPN